jgi:outer membrane protein assembly factor BamD
MRVTPTKTKLVSKKAIAAVVLASLAIGGLSACAGKKPARTQLVYEERPVEQLYATGMKRLDEKSWNEAVSYFEEVERQHPYSEWSRRAIVMTIYANYMANRYEESNTAADHFIQLYPGSPLTPYAYYMKANNYFEQIVDVGRDQAYTVQAQTLLRDVILRYPNSEYAKDARLKLDMVADQLAGKEMEIGRYYLNQNQPLAAAGRFRTVIDRYQTTSHTPEALYRLVETNLVLGLTDEANRNAAVLGHNFPGEFWYNEAYKLMQSRGQTLAVAPDPDAKKVETAAPEKEQKKKKSWLSRITPL